MMRQRSFPRADTPDRRGITLMEVSVSTILVGLIVVGALRCLAASTRTGHATANTTMAVLLAEDLMEEILQQDYSEPDQTPAFGIEGAEAAGVRSDWDDVDDYDTWSQSPPEDSDGVAVADSHWTRTVTVEQVAADDLSDIRLDSEDTGVKQITVVVLYDGVELARLVSVQTTAWVSMIPDYTVATTTGQLPPANQPPDAVISAHTQSATGSLTVTLDASTSTDPENSPLHYEWDFGDGSTSVEEKPVHSFHNTGDAAVVFAVKLLVTDIHGGADSAASTITVFPNP